MFLDLGLRGCNTPSLSPYATPPFSLPVKVQPQTLPLMEIQVEQQMEIEMEVGHPRGWGDIGIHCTFLVLPFNAAPHTLPKQGA